MVLLIVNLPLLPKIRDAVVRNALSGASYESSTLFSV